MPVRLALVLQDVSPVPRPRQLRDNVRLPGTGTRCALRVDRWRHGRSTPTAGSSPTEPTTLLNHGQTEEDLRDSRHAGRGGGGHRTGRAIQQGIARRGAQAAGRGPGQHRHGGRQDGAGASDGDRQCRAVYDRGSESKGRRADRQRPLQRRRRSPARANCCSSSIRGRLPRHSSRCRRTCCATGRCSTAPPIRRSATRICSTKKFISPDAYGQVKTNMDSAAATAARRRSGGRQRQAAARLLLDPVAGHRIRRENRDPARQPGQGQ